MKRKVIKRRKFNLRELVAVPFTNVETRDGRFAKVNFIIPGDGFPLKGVMGDYDGSVFEASWTANGRYLGDDEPGPDDLVIVDEEPKYLQPSRA